MIGRLEFENPPKASYTALTTATYSTIEKVGGESTANTAVKVKDSIFGGINAFASVILADSTGNKSPPTNQMNEFHSDSEDEDLDCSVDERSLLSVGVLKARFEKFNLVSNGLVFGNFFHERHYKHNYARACTVYGLIRFAIIFMAKCTVCCSQKQKIWSFTNKN